MTCFIDTSGVLAVLDRDAREHEAAASCWRGLLDEDARLVTTSYVLVESFALTQARLGMEAARALHTEVYPVLHVHWVDEALHAPGASTILTAGRRGLSLVDCVSFELMRRLGIERALALDGDFREQGFTCLP